MRVPKPRKSFPHRLPESEFERAIELEVGEIRKLNQFYENLPDMEKKRFDSLTDIRLKKSGL